MADRPLPDRDYEVALPLHCGFCEARPGETCRTKSGIELPVPHYTRMPDEDGYADD